MSNPDDLVTEVCIRIYLINITIELFFNTDI